MIKKLSMLRVIIKRYLKKNNTHILGKQVLGICMRLSIAVLSY